MSPSKSVIISCAGIGSRLGLGTTKALININGKSLIQRQLEMFKDIEDLRIVIGFQANKVIEEVLKFRKDVIFIYNHNYFETKTGASFYLGAKDANQYVIEYDGDLLVHPDDIKILLNTDGEWIAYTEAVSDDAIYVTLNNTKEITSFTREQGKYEWTGPCCLQKNHVSYTTENVYNQLEPHLPMRGIKIRACDIDTYNDYQRALNWIKEWD